jgi:hypothetical protein
VTFEPEQPKEELPEYRYSLQYTNMPKKLRYWAIKEFGIKVAGDKHFAHIGKNSSICRKLYGLGYSIQKHFGNMGFTEYSNHVWLRQINEVDGKPMQVCMNCGSLFINDKFIPYTELK